MVATLTCPRITVWQVAVGVLLQKAACMFPEGNGAPKAFIKDGSAAEKTNELLVNAKDAIDELWKQRGYDPKKPEATKARLGYALDKEEAAGYLVTGALHLLRLAPDEARTVGKRVVSLVGPSGAVGYKLKALRKRGKAAAPQIAALLQAEAKLSLAPPPRKGAAPSAPPPPPVPPPAPPPPVAATRAASDALRARVQCCPHAVGQAVAAATSFEMQLRLARCFAAGELASEDFDEEELEIAKLRYKRALKHLSQEIPELELGVAVQLEGVRVSEHSCRRCRCGNGWFAHEWPWMLVTEALGFCNDECSEWSIDLLTWRDEYIPHGVHWCI